MVRIYQSLVLLSAAYAHEDAEAMLQVSKVDIDVRTQELAQIANKDSAVGTSQYQRALQMEANFDQLVAKAVRTGQTPSLDATDRSTALAALETVENELKDEKTANEGTWASANDAVAQCNRDREIAFTKTGGVTEVESVMTAARVTHSSCRDHEDTHRGNEKTACHDANLYAQEAHHGNPPTCACDAFTTAVAVKECLEVALAWSATYQTVLAGKLTTCRTFNVTSPSGTSNDTSLLQSEFKQCDDDQDAFETAFCQYASSLSVACSTEADCYDLQMSIRATVKTTLEVKITSEKIMWKSCQKVRCFLEMLDATKVKQSGYDECKNLNISTSHLDIIYSDADPQAACDEIPVATKPGDEAWATAEYASLTPKQTWLSHYEGTGIKPVTPCSELGSTAAITTASPTTAAPTTAAPSLVETFRRLLR